LLERVRARTRGKEVWLYNTSLPRLTAGQWLFHSPANRYLQWHARMPTADPFDPTDGREGDVQMVYPSMEACPQTPTIHRDLLEMAEGVVDQRWLAWLASQRDPMAKELAGRLARELGSWDMARKTTTAQLQIRRESIIAFARGRR
jgi:hypothetical protein